MFKSSSFAELDDSKMCKVVNNIDENIDSSTTTQIFVSDTINNDRLFIRHTKVSQLRDDPFGNLRLTFDNKSHTDTALIRINTSYKLLECNGNLEFELIKNLHNSLYGANNFFELEYHLITDANIYHIKNELNEYGFLNINDELPMELEDIGKAIKSLCDSRLLLRLSSSDIIPKNYKDIMSFKNPSAGSITDIKCCNDNSNSNVNSNIIGDYDKLRIEDYETIDPVLQTSRTIEIWYNLFHMNGLILDYELLLKKHNLSNAQIKQLGYFKEMQLFKTLDTSNLVIEELSYLFNKELFNDIKCFEEKVSNILAGNNKECPTLSKIKQYLLDTFEFNDNVNNRIQFTTLLTDICKGMYVNDKYMNIMKKSLTCILVDLNLTKKRYSDGIYWYGIVKKPTNFLEKSQNDIILTGSRERYIPKCMSNGSNIEMISTRKLNKDLQSLDKDYENMLDVRNDMKIFKIVDKDLQSVDVEYDKYITTCNSLDYEK